MQNNHNVHNEILEQCQDDEVACLVYYLSRSIIEPGIYYRIGSSHKDLINKLPESLQALAEPRLKKHPLHSNL